MPTNLITEADLRGLDGDIIDWFASKLTPAPPKPNFEWSEIKAAGFTDAQIDAYLRGTGLERWAAQRNIGKEGMILRLREFARTRTTTPTGVVKVRVSKETPEEVYRRTLKEGLETDIEKYMKYLKYAAVAAGGLATVWALKTFKVL